MSLRTTSPVVSNESLYLPLQEAMNCPGESEDPLPRTPHAVLATVGEYIAQGSDEEVLDV
jgi:hypothetical protein